MKKQEIKSEFVKAYLKFKGLTEDEFFKLGKPLGDDYSYFIDSMADKYPGGSIDNRVKESDRFKEFVKNQVDFNPNYEVKYPKIILNKDNVNLIKFNNDKPFYSVDISTRNFGMTVLMSEDLEKVKEVYDKETLFFNIQNKENDILHKIRGIDSIYGEGVNKALIGDEELIGRGATLIGYLKNELEHIDEYFLDGEGESKEEFREATNEIIDDLYNSEKDLEPIYLFVSPMDGKFTIANSKDTLTRFKELEEEIKDIEISKENEESEENDGI